MGRMHWSDVDLTDTFPFLLRLFILAVAINYVWEMAQMPLYRGMPFDELSSWLICFRASLGDGVIVLAIWATGRVVFRRREWFSPAGAGPVVVMLVSGAVVAIAIEVHALAAGRWAYSELMPTVPPFGTGLSPLVQLLVLPWLSMVLARRMRPTPSTG
jgi:hypothetical protein